MKSQRIFDIDEASSLLNMAPESVRRAMLLGELCACDLERTLVHHLELEKYYRLNGLGSELGDWMKCTYMVVLNEGDDLKSPVEAWPIVTPSSRPNRTGTFPDFARISRCVFEDEFDGIERLERRSQKEIWVFRGGACQYTSNAHPGYWHWALAFPGTARRLPIKMLLYSWLEAMPNPEGEARVETWMDVRPYQRALTVVAWSRFVEKGRRATLLHGC